MDKNFPAKHRNWTREDDDVVRQYYAGEITIYEASEMLGRTNSAIHFRGLYKLKLKKTKDAYRIQKPVEWGVLDDGLGGKAASKLENMLKTKALNRLGKFCLSSV